MNIEEIRNVLPHRYPFLLVDRVLEIEPKVSIKALKNVTVNEPFFQGHFPSQPVMPGVLIVEALAQAGGLLMLQSLDLKSSICLLTSIDKAKFRASVRPGDQLILDVKFVRLIGRVGRMSAAAYVDNKKVAEAEVGFALGEEVK